MTFDISVILKNLSKTHVTLKSKKNKRYFTWRPI